MSITLKMALLLTEWVIFINKLAKPFDLKWIFDTEKPVNLYPHLAYDILETVGLYSLLLNRKRYLGNFRMRYHA
jgi:hypothetical protein